MVRILLTHTPHMLANYYGPRALAALRELGDVRLNPGDAVLDTEALAAAAEGCDIVIADRQTPGEGRLFDRTPNLVAFLRCAVDIRNIDVPAASRHGILVTQATPGFIPSVAELAVGFMIDLARRVPEAVEEYRAGGEATVHMGRQLKGSVLGILGYGVIGQYLARLGVALGMTVLVSDPHRGSEDPAVRQTSTEAVLAESDFVVCLAVANERTENLMNAAAFARMKPSAYFINLSRGNLVDEAALEQALDERRIAGAAMDVGRALDQKPSLHLASRADVVATPHVGGLTPQAVEHQAFDTVNQARDLIARRVPPGAVNVAQATRLSRLGINLPEST